MSKILITGCTGLVGNSLLEHLFNSGHSIQCLKRNTARQGKDFWDINFLPESTDNHIEHIVHLAGENVASGRWTKAKKEAILTSRLQGTRELIDFISLLENKPSTFLCASAVGFYGNRGDEILDEKSSLGNGFLADVCRQWEEETKRLKVMGIRVVNLRFGMVLSPDGGALHKMIPAFKLGLGGKIGNGKQYISWVSITDLVRIVAFSIDNEKIEGPVNVVSPIPATNKSLTSALAKALKKPAPFIVPAFAAKILFGEMADEMLLTSGRATPAVLMEAGYPFVDQSLEGVLNYCITKG